MKKKALLRIAGILWGVFLALALLELVLQFLPTGNPPNYEPISASNPIYRREPDKDFIWSKGRSFEIVTRKHSNNYGFINSQDYVPTDSSPLLAVIGDSFIEGLTGPDESIMQGVLQQEVGKDGRVYSFAFAGIQLPMYLAYAQYAQAEFHPDGMVFLIVTNDYDESISTFNNKPNYYYFYPQQDGTMVMKFNPYRLPDDRLLRYSALYRYFKVNLNGFYLLESVRGKISEIYNAYVLPNDSISTRQEPRFIENTSVDSSAERIDLSKKGIDEFFRLLPGMSGLPADRILFLVQGLRYPEELDGPTEFLDTMREHFIGEAQELGYETIDLQPIFFADYEKNRQRFEFPNDWHWNAYGHHLAAEQVAKSRLFLELFRGR